MARDYLLGIDVGTTGAKAVVFDTAGAQVCGAYREYPCTYPRPGWVEQDPSELFRAVCACCRQVLGEAGPGVSIQGVGVSAQRSSTLFLDRSGAPLKLISWLDNRAERQVEEIAQAVGKERFYDITGLPLSPTWMLPKILHTRRHEPRLWERTHKIVQLHDYILRCLGVEAYYTDEPEAGFFGLWDNRSSCWSKELMDAFALPPRLFPDVRRPGERAGCVGARAAEATGIPAGTPVSVGIGDQNGAALGAGVVEPGLVSVSLGTGGLATAVLDRCYRDPQGQAMVTHHAIPGLWTFEGLQNAAAGAFRWFRDEIADSPAAYEALGEMVAGTPPGAEGLLMLPYFAGSAAPRWNAQAKGGFLGLTFAHGRAHMARACMEGIALEQRDILSGLARQGVDTRLVRIIGGATKSPVWNQIQADVYGRPCETLETADSAALGAAICAGVAVGLFGGFRQGAEAMVRVRARYEPRPGPAGVYDELYGLYCDAYSALHGAGVFKGLDRLQRRGADA